MKIGMLTALFVCASAAAAEPAMRLNPLMIDPYRRILVQECYGLRSATAIGAESIEVRIGASLTGSCENPASWRIESETDPDYDPADNAAPIAVAAKSELELKAFPDSARPEFRKWTVTVTPPRPLKLGNRYRIVAQGSESAPVTFGNASASFSFPDDARENEKIPPQDALRAEKALPAQVLGLRGIASVGNGIVVLEFGPAIDPERILDADKRRFSLNGKAISPTLISKRQVVECFFNTDPYEPILRTDLFFQLPEPLRDGDSLRASFDPSVAAGNAFAKLDFHGDETVSPSYLPSGDRFDANGGAKRVFVSNWFGELPANMGGAASFPPFASDSIQYALFLPEQASYVLWRNGKREMIGMFRNVANPSSISGFPLFQIPGVQVYESDFSQIRRPGRCFISSPGIGRSLPFDIVAAGSSFPSRTTEPVESGGALEVRELEGPSMTSRRLFLQYGIMEPDDFFPDDSAEQ